MSNILYIDPNTIMGKSFTITSDPSTTYTCVGYAANETFLIVGQTSDPIKNQFMLKTFKFQEVRFQS